MNPLPNRPETFVRRASGIGMYRRAKSSGRRLAEQQYLIDRDNAHAAKEDWKTMRQRAYISRRQSTLAQVERRPVFITLFFRLEPHSSKTKRL